MVQRSLFILLASLVLAASAAAQPRALWPGVTYDEQVLFTLHGPVVIHVMIGPRPGGTTNLVPLLSNDSLIGRETVTSMQRRASAGATTAGISGDFSAFATGLPSGVLIRESQLLHPPSGDRSSAGVLTDGTLDVRRVSFFATWQGAGGKRVLNDLNGLTPENGSALYTSVYGSATPSSADGVAVVLFPFPAAVPGADLDATVVEARGAGAVPIPAGGAVLVARGQSAQALTAEAPVGTTLTTHFILKPDWPGVVSAIGGGPQIVRDGRPVFRANEAFLQSQIVPRAPRAAVGQLRDGRIVLVAVDGRQPGYSTGMTNFELAQALVRLGAVTAMGLDGGGSVTMGVEGNLVNRPSDGVERPIGDALVFSYTGAYVPPPKAVVSPDGDGIRDSQTLHYKLVRPSTATVTLIAPDGSVAYTQTDEQQPGLVDLTFPPPPAVPAPPAPPAATASTLAARAPADEIPQGRWRLSVSAVDDIGQSSAMTQSFVVNSTIGFLATTPKKLFLPPAGRDLVISWRQTRSAYVVVTLETRAGEVVRTLAKRRYDAAAAAVTWNSLGRDRKVVKGGWYVIRAVARNGLGSIEITRDVRVQRVVGPK
jgi:hypothetical protein